MMTAALSSLSAGRGESPGLWTLAWRSFCRDRLGVVSFLVVVFFFALMLVSALHLVASDWSEEVGVNYAPPAFAGPDTSDRSSREAPPAAGTRGAGEGESSIADPLAGVLS